MESVELPQCGFCAESNDLLECLSLVSENLMPMVENGGSVSDENWQA